MGKIIIDSAGLTANAKSLAANADQYDNELGKIKSAVEELKPYWTDAAGQQFFQLFEQKYAIIDGMGQAIRDLGVAVEKTNNTLSSAIDESMSAFK
ncbi:MAG: WXG100 family type VII secretion target [Bacilli bacterium]|nr:WXG100 family type VII secretion target [Bacilli bacterium]